MKKTLYFAERNLKEMLRDPLSLFFGVVFPVVLLLLLSIINRAIPAEAQMTLFHVEQLTPGIAVFSLSFIALFVAMLIAKDRTSSFMLRLYTSPMTGSSFIFGYLLPLIPMVLAQHAVCFITALCLGLHFTWNVLLCVLVCLPAALVFIALGMLSGTLLSEKAVGGACGALLTNLSAWLSGTWFSLEMIGGAFQTVAYILPFANAVDAGRSALAGDYGAIFEHLWIVIAWAVGLMLLAVLVFRRKMRQH